MQLSKNIRPAKRGENYTAKTGGRDRIRTYDPALIKRML